MQNYSFNEQLKRFEPVEKKCTFCENQEWTNMNTNYFAPVYKVNDRTNLIVYNSVKYNKIPIGIPRCSDCLKIHSNSEIKSYLYALIITIVICGLAYLIFGAVGFVFGSGIGLVAGIIAQIELEKKLANKSGIFYKREGAERNQIIQTFLKSGWSLNKPSPKG